MSWFTTTIHSTTATTTTVTGISITQVSLFFFLLQCSCRQGSSWTTSPSSWSRWSSRSPPQSRTNRRWISQEFSGRVPPTNHSRLQMAYRVRAAFDGFRSGSVLNTKSETGRRSKQRRRNLSVEKTAQRNVRTAENHPRRRQVTATTTRTFTTTPNLFDAWKNIRHLCWWRVCVVLLILCAHRR